MRGSLGDTAAAVIERARRAGAEAAEAFAVRSREFEVTVRRSQVDRIDSAVTVGIGVRVFRHGRQGLACTTDTGASALDRVAAEAIAVAGAAEPEPESALPETALTAVAIDDTLDLADPAVEGLDTTRRAAMAREAEDAALGHPGVSGSEGSTFSDQVREVALFNSLGLAYELISTRCSIASRPMASEEGRASGGQARSWYSSARHLADLEPPARVGEQAARRAVSMSGARSVPPGRAAVIFDPLEAGRFWAGLFGGFSGESVRRGLSWIGDAIGTQIASAEVTLVDDGRIRRGINSSPRDGEGVPRRRNLIVESGKLRTFLYDCRTARKAGGRTTGSAGRGYQTLPGVSPSNFHLAAGTRSPEDLIRATTRGLYVTHVMGFGVNVTTGDYSRGAGGLWIENGEVAFPVQEVVISGRLQEMLRSISLVACDLTLRSGFCSPTFRIDEMTISGR